MSEAIDRDFMALGKAIRENEEDQAFAAGFSLAARALSDLNRMADAVERIAKVLSDKPPET